MGEVREIFDGWKLDPPVFLLLSAFLRGPGEESTTDEMSPSKPSKISGPNLGPGITDGQLAKLSVEAGHQLPIRRGKDPLLPKQKPIFNIDELRKANEMRSKERLERKIQALTQSRPNG